jgi:hypothetical protein
LVDAEDVPPIKTVYEAPGVTAILFLYARAPASPPIEAVAFRPEPTTTTETEVTLAGATHV